MDAPRRLTEQLRPDVQLGLMLPGPPAYDDATAAQIRELVSKQEPIERFYGIDCGLRDPFGNPIRFTQPADGPIVVPSPEEFEAQS